MDYNEYIKPYLCHHGILGMKWGVRRYQNPDGSLTEAGRKRYLTSDGTLTDYGKRKLYGTGQKINKRYQNPDGTLNDAGKKRYYDYDGKSGKVLTRSGAKEVGKDIVRLSKIAIKDGYENHYGGAYKGQLAYIKRKWGENADGMADWAGEHKGAMDKANKLWSKANKKYNEGRAAFEKKYPLAKDMKGYSDEEKRAYFLSKDHFDDLMEKASDTRGIKDKKAKLKRELEILKTASINEWPKDDPYADTWPDVRSRDHMVSFGLLCRINKESGDWYNGKPVTKGFAEKLNAYNKARELPSLSSRTNSIPEGYYDAVEKAESELLGQVLKDIGYEDTKESRKRVRDYVIIE